MQCSGCKAENLAGSLFCTECGVSLEVTCRVCAGRNPPAAKFCRNCGNSLDDVSDARASASPATYMPHHLAQRILTSRSALEGEHKRVTVLFADVKGSMYLAERVDPEQWHRIMDRFFTILADGVHRFEGTVNQYTGDGIMALFGAPIAHEDHGRRACYAALHLGGELRAYGEELKRTHGLGFSVRIGLNSGEVIVGKIGDDLRMHYTAQGHTVGLAARMEQLAAPDRVYITAHTAALVSGFFRLRDLGLFTLKGVSDQIRVYELEGTGPLRTRLEVARTRGLSRFVGRAGESAALEAALGRAVAGQGQVVALVGEAGVGKSRLCYEFAQRCRARGLAVYEAHAVAHGTMIPFLPVLEMLRAYFGVTEHDTGDNARRKIAGTVLLLDEESTEALPLLFDFLAVPDPGQPAPSMDPKVRQHRLLTVLRRLLHTSRRREATVLLFDDLHWIDRSSEMFIESLIEATPGTRTLLLANFRPDYRGAWTKKACYQRVALEPFGSEAVAALLEDLLGADSSLTDLADLIRHRTGGNPFFIEEIVQALADNGTLDGMKGAYRLVQPVGEIAIPATVEAVLAARIDRLSDPEKVALQTAAVIGKEFAEPVLQRIVELPEEALAAALGVLTEAGFIYEQTLFPAREYAFKHPLTQEVAYRAQLGERRMRVHRSVARVMTEIYAERLEERAALLAHHWEAAGEALEAARWHRKAAEWVGVRNFPEAVRHWRRVCALVDPLAEAPETTELATLGREEILKFGVRLGVAEEEREALLAELRVLAERGTRPHDLRSELLFLCAPGAVKLMAGEAAESIDVLLSADRLAEQGGDAGLKVALRSVVVLAQVSAGRLREGLTYAEETLASVEEDPRLGADIFGVSPYILLLLCRGNCLRHMGRLKESARDLDRAVELARSHEQFEVLTSVHKGQVHLARVMGDAQPALDHARGALEAAEKIDSSFSRSEAYAALGHAHLLRCEWCEAAVALQHAVAIVRERRVGLSDEAFMLAGLAEAHLGCGERPLARRLAEEAIGIARARLNEVAESCAHVVMARVLVSTDWSTSRAAIEAGLSKALSLNEKTGGRSLDPFVHLELGELAGRVGDSDTRRQELEEAQRLFMEMGATPHADRLARELAESRQA